MKIGLISDTHDDVKSLRQALDVLDRFNVYFILHCGDVGLEVVSALAGRTVHFVHGNMDDPRQLRAAITDPAHTFHEQLGTLEVEGRRVAFLHGHDVKLLRQTIHSGDWDLICHGHTHSFSHTREGRALVVNPGAISRCDNPSLATIDLSSLEVTEIPLQ
jgi:putative phosphoesterase